VRGGRLRRLGDEVTSQTKLRKLYRVLLTY